MYLQAKQSQLITTELYLPLVARHNLLKIPKPYQRQAARLNLQKMQGHCLLKAVKPDQLTTIR